MIYLPTTQTGDPLFRQFRVYLINWVAWIIPAATDTFARDIGSDYQNETSLFVISVFAAAIALFLFSYSTDVTGVTGWMCLFGWIAIYLVAGILYHLNNHKWGVYIKD